MSSVLVALLEVDFFHLATGHWHRYFLSTPPGYTSARTDAWPDLPYAPLVEEPIDVELAVTSFGEMSGQTAVDIGKAVLINALLRDGMPDLVVRDLTAGAWLHLPCSAGARPLSRLVTEYARGGQKIGVWIGPSTGRRNIDFIAQMSGRCELLEPDKSTLTLTPRDGALDFDAPVLTETYPGTDTIGGLNGPADLKDKTKERVFGHVPSCAPTYLGKRGGRHLFSVNGGHPIEGIVTVKDGYVELPESLTTPAEGEWQQFKSEGTFELGGDYAFSITCEVKGDKTGGVYRTKGADLIAHWATTHSGIMTSGQLDDASVSALATAAPYDLGVFLPSGDTTTLRSLFDDTSDSYRGYWVVDHLYKLTLGQALPPVGSSVATLRRGIDHFGVSIRSQSQGRRMPAKQALVRFGRNYATVSDGELDLRNVTADGKAFATSEYREAKTPEESGVIAAYGASVARIVEQDTMIANRGDAEVEAAALLAEEKEPRQLYDVPCTTLRPELRRLDVITVYDDFPGFEAGKQVRIVGIKPNWRAKTTALVVRD